MTEEDGPLAELHTGNETGYSGLLSAAGSVFNALFTRLQSNSKQSGNRTEKVGVCVLALSARGWGWGEWGRMSEKVASTFKPFLTARALVRLYRELGPVLSMELKTGVSCNSGQTLGLRAPTAHHWPLETAMLQKVEPLNKQARHSL